MRIVYSTWVSHAQKDYKERFPPPKNKNKDETKNNAIKIQSTVKRMNKNNEVEENGMNE